MNEWQSTMDWQTAKDRAALLAKIRAFFYHLNVIEVEVPLLSKGTVTDVHLEGFSTSFDFSNSGKTETYYLQTSPEFGMKRLLSNGYESIYFLGKSFRHESNGKVHNAEFTMLEWYRVGFDYRQLIEEIKSLLTDLLGSQSFEEYSYQTAFLTFTGIDPLETTIEQLKSFLLEQNKLDDWLDKETSIDTLLQFIFAEFVETCIGKTHPCFVYDFPASQASLAQVSKQDERVAHRFECYFKGVELANGFQELTDSFEQLQRFEHDNEMRNKLNLVKKPIDQRFISALENGMPTCSGVALGVDRLAMLALNKNNIKQVLTFPFDRA
ncbi:elongation factor P--(R)-beta-lysine ligase [Thalassotalea agarivorans]|uniref:Lysyl-tRNA synthetase, class 2 n=1 Tax=Thalassotalea agarivorans TaxID=349064 RepID=A0A1I0HXL5_THASX|nr:elongation factor P--(R)-beta-lysine ligase [Thalassotalea agarivorans]SET88042.1 lysyl-tRNA synthetase, class 2 [Thalassotalea agarivorans]